MKKCHLQCLTRMVTARMSVYGDILGFPRFPHLHTTNLELPLQYLIDNGAEAWIDRLWVDSLTLYLPMSTLLVPLRPTVINRTNLSGHSLFVQRPLNNPHSLPNQTFIVLPSPAFVHRTFRVSYCRCCQTIRMSRNS